MVVTEREAKNILCPQKFGTDVDDYRCEGEDCMAWRWACHTKYNGEYPGVELPKEKWKGYCGLGGKP